MFKSADMHLFIKISSAYWISFLANLCINGKWHSSGKCKMRAGWTMQTVLRMYAAFFSQGNMFHPLDSRGIPWRNSTWVHATEDGYNLKIWAVSPIYPWFSMGHALQRLLILLICIIDHLLSSSFFLFELLDGLFCPVEHAPLGLLAYREVLGIIQEYLLEYFSAWCL